MTTKKETKKTIRKMFIAQDGDKFLSLPEKDQENLIAAVLIGYINRPKQSAI